MVIELTSKDSMIVPLIMVMKRRKMDDVLFSLSWNGGNVFPKPAAMQINLEAFSEFNKKYADHPRTMGNSEEL